MTDVTALGDLTVLTALDLRACFQLTDVTALGGLGALTSLDLGGCVRLTDVAALGGLKALTSLDLSGCQQLMDMGALGGLRALTSLDLGYCLRLTDVAALDGLRALTRLSLSGCYRLTDVTALGGLRALTWLSLSGCERLEAFAPIRPLLDHLTNLYLHDCRFHDLDPALCGEISENVLDKVRAHFADAAFQAVEDAELKLFLLGNGGVGKTQLRRRLCDLDFDESIASTHGVEVSRFPLTLAGKQTVHLNLWDFGGQDVYHGTHALFLQEHAVYVILWHPEMEAGTVDDHGITVRRRPLAYWLDFARSVAGTEAPVIIVQSQFDDANGVPAAIEADLSDFRRARKVEASAKTDDGLERLLPELKRSVNYLLAERPILPIGSGRGRVRDQLRKWLAVDQARPADQRKYRTLSWKKFVKLCEKGNGDVSSPEALADFLHRTGFFMYDPRLFRGEIILDQGWVLEAVYAVFHREHCVRRLRQQGGRFTRAELGDWLWNGAGHGVDDQDRFIGMMLGCGICFPLRRLSDVDEWPEVWQYAVPDHLPTLADFQRLYPTVDLPDPQTADVAATIAFRFLHDGLLRGLLARLGEVGKHAADYWRYGCYFRDPSKNARFRLDATTTPEGPSAAGSITLSAWGAESRVLIERVLDEVRRLSPGQAVEPKWSIREADGTPRPWPEEHDTSVLDLRRRVDDLERLLLRPAARVEPELPESVRLIRAMADLAEGQLAEVATGLGISPADLPRSDLRTRADAIYHFAVRDATGERLKLLRHLIRRYNSDAFD